MNSANATITMIPVRISFEYFTEQLFGCENTKKSRIRAIRDALLAAEIQLFAENRK
jgi:hypothetical protein